MVAYTTTGRYPDWWEGRRFDSPTDWWVAGKTAEATRDVPQKILLGKDLEDALGTGMIPKSCILKVSRKQLSEACDRVSIRHVSGGVSRVQFKAYEQDVTKFRGTTLHGIWWDEEPPEEIYSEGMARLTAHSGLAMLTLTPLEGMTRVVRYFYPEPNTAGRALIRAEIESCGLYTSKQIESQLATYAPHEREARARGIPLQGSGPVFPIEESAIVVPDFEIPRGWKQIIGMDFGLGDHPTGACLLALQPGDAPGQERIYVTRDYKAKEPNPVLHAAALKPWGKLPVSWPHDGNRLGDVQSMQPLSGIYRRHGLRMLPEHATFPEGGFGVEAGLQQMLEYMTTGRWKVFSSCATWLEEFRHYHRKKGAIVKEDDDCLSASRYAFVMRRFARASTEQDAQNALPAQAEGLHSNLFTGGF